MIAPIVTTDEVIAAMHKIRAELVAYRGPVPAVLPAFIAEDIAPSIDFDAVRTAGYEARVAPPYMRKSFVWVYVQEGARP